MRTIEARSCCESLIAPRFFRAQCAPVLTVALSVVLGTVQAGGQVITVTPAKVSSPTLQSVAGTCSNYQNTLATTGVQVSGIPHPGSCASSVLVPLFNGQNLTNDWRQLLLGPNPPKFHETVTTNGQQTCIVPSDFTVDLSAIVHVWQLDWTTVPVVGSACTSESNRVKATSVVSALTLIGPADKILNHSRLMLRTQLLLAPVCGANQVEAKAALYREVWGLINVVAEEERNAWHDPESSLASQCVPQCALCSAGWVGTLTCKKTIRDSATATNYTWDENQTWIVGGPPQQQMGATSYPATFAAKGGGSKTGIIWSVNQTSAGSLNVSGTQQMPTFDTSQITITDGIASSPPGHEADEIAFQLQPFSLSPNTFTIGSTTVPPNQAGNACDTPAKPGTAGCRVDCTWNFVFQ